MPVPNRMLPFFGLACFVLCASLGRSRAEDQADPPPGEKEAERPAQPLVITKPERPVKLPAGPSASGWDLLLKNDFDGARKSLEAALQANPDDLPALEALRAVAIMQGRYGESQQLNIRMVKASAGSTLCQGLAMRAMDGLSFSETRNELVQAFLETEAKAAPAVRATLQDLLATLYLSRDETEKASAALKDLGYVDRWQFVTGPFGAGDRNNPMERRFPPEQELKELKFSDEKGKPVPVRADLPVGFRTLSLGRLFPGAQGIFYAFTNLESEGEQEVLLVSGAPNGARFYLRGVPVLQADPKERFPRSPTIVRTRLLKGSNALLVKLPFASDLVVRVLATDYSPAPGVKAALLPPEDVAKHRVAPVRGYVFSEAAEGALARHFLEKLPAEARGGPDRFANLARNGELDAAEMRWLDLAVRQESDPPAREALARRMVGTWPDSAHMLDFAAQALASVGQEASHADTRHAEEARQMRERALQLVPGNHQHLLALAEFMQQHQLPEQAFELLKTCAQSYPDSAFAQERLGQTYLSKGMLALAEQRYEAAAKLEPAFLPQLARFHEMAGDRSRALQLRAELVKRGMEPAMERHRRLVDTGALDEASAILDEQERAFPERQDELLVLRAELLIERGDLEGAYKLRAELLKRQPRNRGALIGLFDLALRMGKQDEARDLLAKRLKDHPDDFELRRRMRELDGQGGEQWWKPYDVEVAQIDTTRFTQENYPRSNHAWIVDFMVTKIYPDLSRESYVHIAQKVLNLDGINELSEQLLEAQRQDMVFVRTLNPDGSVFQPKNVHDFNFAQSASYYRVGPGSILEHAYLEHAEPDEFEPAFGMAFNFNALDAPRAVSRWVVLVPKQAKLDIRKIRPELVDEKILEGPEGYTVYQWTNKQVEGIKVEPFMPGEQDQETIPLVFVESRERPFRATNWLQLNLNDALPEEAAEVATRIAKALPDEEHRFRALCEWVRLNIQPGQEARTLDDIWDLRAGSTGLMTRLAAEMCRAAGLDARLAFVNGTYLPGRVFTGKNARRDWEPSAFTNFGSLGQMLMLSPKDGPEQWLQFTGQPARDFDLRYVADDQIGALALTFGDEGVRIKRVLGEQLGALPLRHDVSVALDEQGHGAAQGTLHLFGTTGGSVRRELDDPRKAAQIREGIVRNFWPNIGLNDVKILDREHADRPLRFVYAGAVPDLALKAEQAWFLQPFLSPSGIQRLIGPPERIHDLVLRSEVAELDQHVAYECPAGYAWVQAPDDLYVVTEFGFYLADFNVVGRKLYCNRSYLMPLQRVTPEKYPALMNFLRKTVELEGQRVAYAKRDFPGFGNLAREQLSQGYASHGPDEKEKAPAPEGPEPGH